MKNLTMWFACSGGTRESEEKNMKRNDGVSMGFNKGISYGQKAFCFTAIGLKLICLACQMVAMSMTPIMFTRMEATTSFTIASLFVDMVLVALVAGYGGVPLSFVTTEIPLNNFCHTFMDKLCAYAVLVLTVIVFLLIAGFISIGGYGVHSIGAFVAWMVAKVAVTVTLVVGLSRKYDTILDS